MEPRPLKELLAEMATELEVPVEALIGRDWALPPPRGLECLCLSRKLETRELERLQIPGPAFEIVWTRFEINLVVFARNATHPQARTRRFVCTIRGTALGRHCQPRGRSRAMSLDLDDYDGNTAR